MRQRQVLRTHLSLDCVQVILDATLHHAKLPGEARLHQRVLRARLLKEGMTKGHSRKAHTEAGLLCMCRACGRQWKKSQHAQSRHVVVV